MLVNEVPKIKQNVSKLQGEAKDTSYKKDIESLKKEVSGMKDLLKKQPASFADAVKGLEKEAQTLKRSIKQLEDRVEEKPKLDECYVEPAIHELAEREKRAYNILVFGIQERSESDRNERISQEKECIENVLKEVDKDVKVNDLKLMRLGKYDPQKVRPIKVIFPTKEEAPKILKQKNKLSKDNKVYIKSDQTTEPRKYLKSVIQELEDRKVKGEINLKIKYILGTPKIVKIPSSTSTSKN